MISNYCPFHFFHSPWPHLVQSEFCSQCHWKKITFIKVSNDLYVTKSNKFLTLFELEEGLTSACVLEVHCASFCLAPQRPCSLDFLLLPWPLSFISPCTVFFWPPGSLYLENPYPSQTFSLSGPMCFCPTPWFNIASFLPSTPDLCIWILTWCCSCVIIRL